MCNLDLAVAAALALGIPQHLLVTALTRDCIVRMQTLSKQMGFGETA